MEQRLDINQAIQIAKLLSTAPKDRLDLILSVFREADLDLGNIEDIRCLSGTVHHLCDVDTESIVRELTSDMKTVSNREYRVSVQDFNEFCKSKSISPNLVKKHLAGVGIIRISTANGRINYTCAAYNDEEKKPQRYICIYKDWEERLKGESEDD